MGNIHSSDMSLNDLQWIVRIKSLKQKYIYNAVYTDQTFGKIKFIKLSRFDNGIEIGFTQPYTEAHQWEF